MRVRLRAPGALDGRRQRGRDELLGRAAGHASSRAPTWRSRSTIRSAGRSPHGALHVTPSCGPIEPGTYTLKLTLSRSGRRAWSATSSVELSVPEVGGEVPAGHGAGRGQRRCLGRGGRPRRRGRGAPAAPVGESKLKILPPDARGADRPAAARGRRRAADHEGRVLSRGQARRQPDAAAVLGRDRPRRKSRGGRRVRAVGYDSSGRVIDEDAWSVNQGNGAPGGERSCPQPDPAGRQGPRQGRRAVDRGRRGAAGRALPRRQEARQRGRRGPLRDHDPVQRVREGRLPPRHRRSRRTARKPTTSIS